MAVMARVLGIPARVAIGFLTPDAGRRRTPGSTAPATCTPGPSSTSTAPAGSASSPRRPDRVGSRAGLHRRSAPARATGPSASAASRAAAESSLLPNNRSRSRSPTSSAPQRRRRRRQRPGWLLVAAPLLARRAGRRRAAAPPRPCRRRRRERRLAGGDPELVWAELRDTAIDLGVPWPAGRSPRATRDATRRPPRHAGRPADPGAAGARPGDRPRRPSPPWTGSSASWSCCATPGPAPSPAPTRAAVRADAETCVAASSAAPRARPAAGRSGGRGRCSPCAAHPARRPGHRRDAVRRRSSTTPADRCGRRLPKRCRIPRRAGIPDSADRVTRASSGASVARTRRSRGDGASARPSAP